MSGKNTGKNKRKKEDEFLQKVVARDRASKKKEWLPAGFGEREKQLRNMHRLSQQDVADILHTSVSTISRLENGLSSTIDIELISGLADLYDVSTDFLLGKLRNPERLYYSLKDVGLTPEAGLALYSGKADAPTVNRLLEDEEFQGLTYAIKDYLISGQDGNGKPLGFLVEMMSDPKTKIHMDYWVTPQKARMSAYAGKMNSLCEQRSIDALGDGLKTAVQGIRAKDGSVMRSAAKLTAEMMQMIKEGYPKDNDKQEGHDYSPEAITEQMIRLFAPDGELKENERLFLLDLRNALISMKLDEEENEDSVGGGPD